MKTILRILTFIFVLGLVPVSADAHRNLDKNIAELEKMPRVEYVAYNERRNPQTKKVYKSSKVIVIPSVQEQRVLDLMKAFRSDSKDAVSFSVTNNGMVYSIEFIDGKERRRYTLVRNDGRGNALLTVEYVNSANIPSNTKAKGHAGMYEDFDFDDEIYDFDPGVNTALAESVGVDNIRIVWY